MEEVTFVTPQEKRLKSLEERIDLAERQLRIILNLIADLNEVVLLLDKTRDIKNNPV